MSGKRTPAARSPTPRSSKRPVTSGPAPASGAGFLLPRGFIRAAQSAFSPDLSERRECFQYPTVELGEEAGQKGDAGQHQQSAHHALHMAQMGAKAGQEGRERLDR